MKEKLKALVTPARKAMVKTYVRAVAAGAITTALAIALDVAPQYATLIGALAAPAVKWADKAEKEYGRGSK